MMFPLHTDICTLRRRCKEIPVNGDATRSACLHAVGPRVTAGARARIRRRFHQRTQTGLTAATRLRRRRRTDGLAPLGRPSPSPSSAPAPQGAHGMGWPWTGMTRRPSRGPAAPRCATPPPRCPAFGRPTRRSAMGGGRGVRRGRRSGAPRGRLSRSLVCPGWQPRGVHRGGVRRSHRLVSALAFGQMRSQCFARHSHPPE